MNQHNDTKDSKLMLQLHVLTNPIGTAQEAVPIDNGAGLVCNDVVAKASVLAVAVYWSMLTISQGMET